MKIETLPAEFEPARPILSRIEEAGFEAYFVGGCVRDTILNLPIHDIDIATSAYPAEIKQIFSRTVDTGIEHGTVMILDHGTGYETTTFRTESGYQDFRRPDSVTFVRSLKEDLQRRDFTINALALKEDGTVVDLFDGLGDLKRHLIKAVGDPAERFHEDALRMMRAARFAAKLGFQIEPGTLAGMSQNAALLEKIAVERIQVEFEKLLLGKAVQNGLAAMLDTKLYLHCPGLKEGGQGLQYLAQQPLTLNNATQAWGALAICLGLDKNQLRPFLKGWKLSNGLITAVSRAVPLVEKLTTKTAGASDLYQAGQQAVADAVVIANSLGGQVDPQAVQAAYQALPIKESGELALNGGDLIKAGVKPGPAMGKTLTTLTKQVVEGQLANDYQTLLKAAGELLKA